MSSLKTKNTASKPHPYETYQDILERDTRPVPEHLREAEVREFHDRPIPASRYYDADFFQKEVDFVWSRVWQMACREEDIPNVGDFHVYENVGKSLIIVRSAPDEIKAFYNSCLHRGRQLVAGQGCRDEFKCPFHGMSWNLDGSFKYNPIEWDFPQWREQSPILPEAKLGTWGGFIFVNFDLEAQPLDHFIAPIAKDFEPYDFPNRYKALHLQKVIKANWKAAAEAFMESHHTVSTHPQLTPYLGDVNSQYDFVSDYVSRHFSAMGVSSPLVGDRNYSEADIAAAFAKGSGARRPTDSVVSSFPEGVTARAHSAEVLRSALGAGDGWDYSEVSDAEMVDALLYNLWPHMTFWAGFGPNLIYRWRPLRLDPSRSIMDIMILKRVPKDGPRPKPAAVIAVGENDRLSDLPALGGLATILDQDMGNLSFMEDGLRSSKTGEVHLAGYSEIQIRRMHNLLEEFIASGSQQT